MVSNTISSEELMKSKNRISRRSILKGAGLVSAMPLLTAASYPSASGRGKTSEAFKEISEKVWSTPFIDTHEHLIEEHQRLAVPPIHLRSDDWSMLMSHYLDSDFLTAGMSQQDYQAFYSTRMDPEDKWALIAPWWPHVRNTGYGQAAQITMRELYQIEELSASTVHLLQERYESVRRPGFYRMILEDICRIESCQVNYIGRPFCESRMPLLLMQDISIRGMYAIRGKPASVAVQEYSEPAGMKVMCLTDWHRVIDWWFDKYGRYAVAVKSQNAYSRDIDHEQISAEIAEPIFKELLDGERLDDDKKKALEDHLFWYAVARATEHHLPVKLHTGYYAGQNINLPLWRIRNNPASASDLCRRSPKTSFVFMHIGYPYYEEMIALAKHYTNAHIDMCWSWLINPSAAKDFLKKYLVAAPANKLLSFGGDYFHIEPVVGHASLARHGITQALTELVIEGWIKIDAALDLADAIMHQNARRIFHLNEKAEALKQAEWAK